MTKAKIQKDEVTLGSKRKAPMIIESIARGASSKKRRRKEVADESLTSHARRVMHIYPPSEAASLRLSLKLERKKAEDGPEQDQRQVEGGTKQPQSQPQEANSKAERKQATSSTVDPQRNVTEKWPQQTQQQVQQRVQHPGQAGNCAQQQQQPQQQHQQKPRDNAREDEAIQRLLRKRRIEAPKASGEEAAAAAVATSIMPPPAADQGQPNGGVAADEVDDELIEHIWQDLVDNQSMKDQARSDDELVEDSPKKPRLDEPDFDHNPKLPGDSGITSAIQARLRIEAKGGFRDGSQGGRITVNEHTAKHEGKHSGNDAKRPRGVSSERNCKVRRGNAVRIRTNDMQALERIAKHSAASASSRPLRNVNGVSCSSEEGSGRHVK